MILAPSERLRPCPRKSVIFFLCASLWCVCVRSESTVLLQGQLTSKVEVCVFCATGDESAAAFYPWKPFLSPFSSSFFTFCAAHSVETQSCWTLSGTFTSPTVSSVHHKFGGGGRHFVYVVWGFVLGWQKRFFCSGHEKRKEYLKRFWNSKFQD